MRSPGRLCLILAAVTCALAFPAGASAAVTLTNFSVTPSTTQAGGHPDLRISTSFTANPSDDDVRDVTVRLAKGLVGNPKATPKCPVAAFNADTCPANTAVGSVAVTADATVLLATSTVTSNGTVYNLPPVGSEPARLGIKVRPDPIGPVNIRPISLIGVAKLGPETGYALETTFPNQPRQADSDAGPVPLAVRRIDLTLKGQPGATPFTINPSSCALATSTATAVSYDAPQTPSSRSASFTPTGCGALRFAPAISGTIGAKGANRKGQLVPLTTVFDFPANGSSLKDSVVTLPKGVAPQLQALSKGCPATTPIAQCPASATVGSATASSPLLDAPLKGPVVLQASATEPLPKLVVRLFGAVPLTLEGVSTQAGTQLRNSFPNAPDVPLSRFALTLNGGKKGLLEAPGDLCAKTRRTIASFVLVGHNGTRVAKNVTLKPGGCKGYRPAKPKVAANLRKGALKLRLTRTGDARLKTITVKPPKGFAFRKVAGKANGKFTSLSRKGGVVRARLRGKGVTRLTLSTKLVRRVARGHRIALRVVATDSYGKTRRTLRVRGR